MSGEGCPPLAKVGRRFGWRPAPRSGRRRFPCPLSVKPPYPPARKSDTVDDYHGVRVADPYRWLEDADTAETSAWVEAQNALTRSILHGPVRDALITRLTALYDFPAHERADPARRPLLLHAQHRACRISRCSIRRTGPTASGAR